MQLHVLILSSLGASCVIANTVCQGILSMKVSSVSATLLGVQTTSRQVETGQLLTRCLLGQAQVVHGDHDADSD